MLMANLNKYLPNVCVFIVSDFIFHNIIATLEFLQCSYILDFQYVNLYTLLSLSFEKGVLVS